MPPEPAPLMLKKLVNLSVALPESVTVKIGPKPPLSAGVPLTRRVLVFSERPFGS